MKFGISSVIVVFFFLCGGIISAKSSQALKVATFNIRLDTPVDGINTWSLRKDSMCAFLQRSRLALFGMQEVKHNQLVDLQNCLSGFSSVGVGRDDGKEGGEYSPLFYDNQRFDLLASNTFWLSETPEIPGVKGWDSAYPRIVTWAKLKDKLTRKILFVFNTHFDHQGVEARRQSALLIQQKVAEIAPKGAVLILGDFNSTPAEEAYKTMVAADKGFADSRLSAQSKSGELWSFHGFGTVKLEERELIDFIFTKGSLKALKYENPFIENEGHYLSDHNPILVTLTFSHWNTPL